MVTPAFIHFSAMLRRIAASAVARLILSLTPMISSTLSVVMVSMVLDCDAAASTNQVR